MLEGFGKRLKTMRQLEGFSTSQFSELIGVSAASLRAYERVQDSSSIPKPTIETLTRIGEVLSVSLDYLCYGYNFNTSDSDASSILKNLFQIIDLFDMAVIISEIPDEQKSHYYKLSSPENHISEMSFSVYEPYENGTITGPEDPDELDERSKRAKTSTISFFDLFTQFLAIKESGLKEINVDAYETAVNAICEKCRGYTISKEQGYIFFAPNI